MTGRCVRAIRFRERSKLPLSAACLVASGVREALSPVIGAVSLRLFEPVLPSVQGWSEIVRDARIYRVHGSLGEAAVILRPADASALASGLFGENAIAPNPLSPLETAALDRTMDLVASHLAPICGDALRIEAAADAGTLTSYFELQIDRPLHARIGIGLRREPLALATPGIVLEDLADLPIPMHVRMDVISLSAGLLAALEPGDLLPLPKGALRGSLLAAGRILASGECGVSADRYALSLDPSPVYRGAQTQ